MSGHLYLVGFMGAGKSTVGGIIAERTEIPFTDLDHAIESTAGRSIQDIFSQDGEAIFRSLEARELRRISDDAPSVVACGGGIASDPANVELMRATGTVVYLETDVDSVVDRVPADGTRPLLGDRGRIEALLKERRVLYEGAAHIVVSTMRKDPGLVVEEVLEAIGAPS